MGIMAVSAGLLGACSSSRASSSSTQAATSSASSATQGSEAASTATSSSSDAAEASTSTQAANKTLVVVFSWSGNTLAVADRIASDLQTDVFRIEPETPYTKDYNEMLQIAQNEQAANTMPALAANVQAWDSYSTIYLGFPTWWGHLPQIVKSFLATHDCTGKTIYPFNTHAGSGFASCLSDLSAACPGADVREGLSLVGDNVSSSTERIDEWVSTNA
jgi:flavodoxin